MPKCLLRFSTFLLTLLFILPLTYATPSKSPLLFINDQLTSITSPIIETRDQIYVSLRAISECLDLDLSFDDLTHTVNVQYENNIFTYSLKDTCSYFNTQPISLDTFIQEGRIYIDALPFFPLFGFDVDYDQSLFISTYLGQELLDLPYLPEPMLIDIYDDVPVTSVLINQIKPANSYCEGTFGGRIIDGFYENETLFISFIPYTLIPCPDEYNTLSTPCIINFDNQALCLPVAPTFEYTYLADPDLPIKSRDLDLLYKKLLRGEIYLSELTTSNASISSLKQLYTP